MALIHGTVKLGGLVLETLATVRLSAAYPERAVNKLRIKAVVKVKSFKSILEYAKQKTIFSSIKKECWKTDYQYLQGKYITHWYIMTVSSE